MSSLYPSSAEVKLNANNTKLNKEELQFALYRAAAQLENYEKELMIARPLVEAIRNLVDDQTDRT